MCYNRIIGRDYYNDKNDKEVIFMKIFKDAISNALDVFREPFGVDFPTMDFMGFSIGELTDKVWECIDSGSPVETNFDDEIKY